LSSVLWKLQFVFYFQKLSSILVKMSSYFEKMDLLHQIRWTQAPNQKKTSTQKFAQKVYFLIEKFSVLYFFKKYLVTLVKGSFINNIQWLERGVSFPVSERTQKFFEGGFWIFLYRQENLVGVLGFSSQKPENWEKNSKNGGRGSNTPHEYALGHFHTKQNFVKISDFEWRHLWTAPNF